MYFIFSWPDWKLEVSLLCHDALSVVHLHVWFSSVDFYIFNISETTRPMEPKLCVNDDSYGASEIN